MKRFLALLLALVMVFSLAACGEKTPDNNDNNKENNNKGDDKLTSLVTGVSVADLDALLRVFLGNSAADSTEELTGIKDIYLEVGATDERGLLGLGANIANKQYDVDLHYGEAIVLSAPALLDKNYGLSAEGMESFMEDFMEGFTGAIAPSTGSASGMLTSMDPEAVAALITKYYNKAIDELKKAEGITASGNTINGELTPAGAATVIVNVLEAVLADDDFYAILAPMMGMTAEEVKQNLLQGKPDTATLISQLTDMLSMYDLTVKIKDLKLNDKNAPLSGDLYISVNQEVETDEVRLAEISAVFDFEKGTINAYFKDEGTELIGLDVSEGKFDARFNIDGASGKVHMETTESSVKGYVEMNGEKMVELDVTVSDTEMNFKLIIARTEYVVNIKTVDSTVTGTLTMDGQEMGKLVFDKKVSGSKTSYTVKTLTINATTVDFSEAGICFYVDTDPQIPAAPSNYTDISTLTQDDLAAIGEKFLEDNADLIEWFGNKFGGSAESAPNQSEDYYYGDL